MAINHKDTNPELFYDLARTLPPSVHDSSGNHQKPLYLPHDSVRARVYLGHGLIYPFEYDSIGGTGSYRDLQSHTAGAITLYDSTPPNRKEQLVMHVLLTDDEQDKCIRADNTLLFCEPLPISRVVRIGVPVRADELDTYLKGWIYPDIPVNPLLYFANGLPDNEPVTNVLPKLSLPTLRPKSTTIEDAIVKFNRYMGLFAHMRNVDKYFSSDSCSYSEYPDVFLSLYKILYNKDIPNPKSNDPGVFRLIFHMLGLLDSPTELEQEIIDLLISNETFLSKERARNVAATIWKNTGELPEIKDAFHAIFQDEDYKSALYFLQKNELPNAAIISASLLIFLYQYSRRDANDRRNLIQNFCDGWKTKPDIGCLILAAMGFYYGYTALDALETKPYETHPWIAEYDSSIEVKAPPIKFHLTSCFERVVIETVYQWAFYKTQPVDNHLALYSHLQNTGSL